MTILHALFCLFLLISSLLVVFSANPINSIIFLILAFFNSAFILFFFNAEFFGLIFIIIYVGAIAVLFLFVIMMLNVKLTLDSQHSNYISSPFFNGFFFMYFLTVAFFYLSNKTFSANNFLEFKNQNLLVCFDTLNNIDIFGQIFYNYFSLLFLIAGIILLIALIGSIILTLGHGSFKKNQLSVKQLSRTRIVR